MDSLFSSLSPEELYDLLQSLDDDEKIVRVVGNNALLIPLGSLYELLHTSREAVWDAMRAEKPTLPVAKTMAKAWSNPGMHLGRSAFTRLIRVAQGTEITKAIPDFVGLDYVWPRANEWTGLFASDFFSQDVSKQFWITFVKDAMKLNAVELHPDHGRLNQWVAYSRAPTVIRFGCPAMRQVLAGRLSSLSGDEAAEVAPLLERVHVADTLAVLIRLWAWCVADLTVELWEQVEQDGMENDVPLQELLPSYDKVAGEWSNPMQAAIDRLARLAGWQREQKATRFLGALWAPKGASEGADSRIRLLRYWVQLKKGRPKFESFLRLARVVAAKKLRAEEQDPKIIEQFAWYQAVILRVAETLSHVRIYLSSKGYSVQEISDLMSIYEHEFRAARKLLRKPLG